MNNIDELIELNLYEPISRYLTVLEEENGIIKVVEGLPNLLRVFREGFA